MISVLASSMFIAILHTDCYYTKWILAFVYVYIAAINIIGMVEEHETLTNLSAEAGIFICIMALVRSPGPIDYWVIVDIVAPLVFAEYVLFRPRIIIL